MFLPIRNTPLLLLPCIISMPIRSSLERIVLNLASNAVRYTEAQGLGGFRTHFGVPLLREGNLIGVILVSRTTVQWFDDKHRRR